jgi:two-component system, chemotaxis family, response regulator Rcp1
MELLLIEDNPADVRLVREALVESGLAIRLHWAASGEEALGFLHRQAPFQNTPTPDLVLLDLNLPGLSGHEVLTRIKSDPALLTIPVVALTSSAALQDVLDAYRAHVNSYMIKPVDFVQFLTLVNTIRSYWLTSVLLPTRAG